MKREHIDLILGTLHKEKQIWRIEALGRDPEAAMAKIALCEEAEQAFREVVGLG